MDMNALYCTSTANCTKQFNHTTCNQLTKRCICEMGFKIFSGSCLPIENNEHCGNDSSCVVYDKNMHCSKRNLCECKPGTAYIPSFGSCSWTNSKQKCPDNYIWNETTMTCRNESTQPAHTTLTVIFFICLIGIIYIIYKTFRSGSFKRDFGWIMTDIRETHGNDNIVISSKSSSSSSSSTSPQITPLISPRHVPATNNSYMSQELEPFCHDSEQDSTNLLIETANDDPKLGGRILEMNLGRSLNELMGSLSDDECLT